MNYAINYADGRRAQLYVHDQLVSFDVLRLREYVDLNCPNTEVTTDPRYLQVPGDKAVARARLTADIGN